MERSLAQKLHRLYTAVLEKNDPQFLYQDCCGGVSCGSKRLVAWFGAGKMNSHACWEKSWEYVPRYFDRHVIEAVDK